MNTLARPWILGVAASHNGAVCLLHGDELVVAIQEERLTRVKRARIDGPGGTLALQYCLDYARISVEELSAIVIASLPRYTPGSRPGMVQLPLRALAHQIPVIAISHHWAHAVGAFATSGFKDAAVLVIDGGGSNVADLPEVERAAILPGSLASVPGAAELISLYAAEGAKLTPLEKHVGVWMTPSSDGGMSRFGGLGGMYAATAEQIFGDTSESGKVMGLAPHGRPTIPVSDFLEWKSGQFVFKDIVPTLFPYRERWPARSEEYCTLAASVQAALEFGLTTILDRLRAVSRSRNLCYAGGVALNSVANERLLRHGAFDDLFVMPAAEDSGTAIGAAYWGLWAIAGEQPPPAPKHDAVGRTYSSVEIRDAVSATPGVYSYEPPDVIEATAEALARGEIVGWFRGRSELGPRALGQRSILCDPRGPSMKAVLNERVKHREAFRPFAPAVLREEARLWFDLDGVSDESRFMLRVVPILSEKQSMIPAVVHVDGTGRLQTVTAEDNGPFYALIESFHRRTGVPMLLNTSFNVAGEPIVESPEDALWCLLYTQLDCVSIDSIIVRKNDNFKSILQMHFVLTATSFDVRSPISGHFKFDMASDVVRFETSTRWGRHEPSLSTSTLPILEAIGAGATGWQILERMTSGGDPIGQRELIRILGFLHRLSIVRATMPQTE